VRRVFRCDFDLGYGFQVEPVGMRSSSRNAVSFSSLRATNLFPLSRCASTIQIVRPRFFLLHQRNKPSAAGDFDVPVSGLDLASLLQGEDGLFLCQNRGQNYIAVAKASHSIAFGPTPIGRVIQEQVSTSLGPEPWFVTKISNSTELAEFRVTTGGPIASR
jgi:hypothetical protein